MELENQLADGIDIIKICKKKGLSNKDIRKDLTLKFGLAKTNDIYRNYYRSKIISFGSTVIILLVAGFFFTNANIIGNVILSSNSDNASFYLSSITLSFIAAFVLGVMYARLRK